MGKSKCPRQRDFNLLYIKYCGEIFSGRNGPELLEKLEEKITSLKNHWEGVSIEYQFLLQREQLHFHLDNCNTIYD